MKKPKRTSNANQSDSFIKAARELGCDESEAAFDEKLKKVAAHKPKNEPKAGKAKK